MEFLLLFYSLGLLGLYFLLLPYFKTHMHTLTNKNIKKSSWHSFLFLLFIYYLQNEKVKFLGFFIFVVLDAVIFSIWWVVFWNQRRWVWGWENCKPFHYCLLVSVVQPAVVLCCAVPLSGNFFIKMHSYQLVCGIFILVLINNFFFPFLFTLKKNCNIIWFLFFNAFDAVANTVLYGSGNSTIWVGVCMFYLKTMNPTFFFSSVIIMETMTT